MILKKALCCSVLSLALGNALGMDPDVISGVSEEIRSLSVSSPKISAEDRRLYKNLAPTLAIMKMFLKDDFKPLTGNESEVEKNLRDNVEAFFGSSEFTPAEGGRQEINLDDELTDILCDLIKREQKESLSGNVTFYHGMTGSNLLVYKYFARLFSHLTGQDLGDCVLRGDHLYAKNPKTGKLFETLQELKDTHEFKNDYDRGIDISALQCNIALSVGPGTSLSTASSVGLFCNSYSVIELGVSRLITPALILQGMSIADARESAKKVEGLFNGYSSDLGGALLAISLPSEDANKLAKHIWMGGEAYDPVTSSAFKQFFDSDGRYIGHELIRVTEIIKSIDEDTPINEVIKKVEDAHLCIDDRKTESFAEQLKKFSSLRSSERSSINYLLESLKNSLNKDLSKEEVYFLTNELSLYLHPEMKANIFGAFRHPLPIKEARLLGEKIDELAASHAELIIKRGANPADGAFSIPRKVATDKSMSYQLDVLPIFIERGMFSKAQQIIEQHPGFLENAEITRLVLSSILKALYDNYDEVLKFVEGSFGINELLSKIPEDELYPFLHMFARKNTNVAIGKLLKSLNNKELDDRVFADLISGFLSIAYSAPDLSLTSVLENKQLSQRVMEKVLSRMDFEEYSAGYVVVFFMNKGFSFNPNEKEGKEHFDELSKVLKENFHLSSYEVDQYILDFYGLNKEDCPQLAKFLDGFHSKNDYSEKKQELLSYLESDRVGKEDKKSRIKELTLRDQFFEVMRWLDYGDKNQRILGEELSKEINYPGSSMTIFEACEMFKKYVL